MSVLGGQEECNNFLFQGLTSNDPHFVKILSAVAVGPDLCLKNTTYTRIERLDMQLVRQDRFRRPTAQAICLLFQLKSDTALFHMFFRFSDVILSLPRGRDQLLQIIDDSRHSPLTLLGQ